MSAIAQDPKYRMRISRLTLDKLGIKLYDRVASVLAELVANSHDADAHSVVISLPVGEVLADRTPEGIVDRGYEVTVSDDGHGMTSQQVNDYYLHVGLDRRVGRGQMSPGGRRVMGRKGIGKLAPFGICREIRVVTAGGEPDGRGLYEQSDLMLELDAMMTESEEPYPPTPGPLDGIRVAQRGTTITMRVFANKRVPSRDELHRQLSARFGITRTDWSVRVEDSLGKSVPFVLGELTIPLLEGTKIDLSTRPVPTTEGDKSVSGWVAYAKDPYQDDAMAGVRVYARGKLVAQTRDFDVGTGFTGEFKLRSYLVGVLHADWLDEEEDLIRSDRQDILWSSLYGEALRAWGKQLIRDLAQRSEASVGRQVWDEFAQASRIEARVQAAVPRDRGMQASILRAARELVKARDRDAIRREEYRDSIVQLAFAIGPHRELLATLEQVATDASSTMDTVLRLLAQAHLAEIYSLGQVADERVRTIAQLRRLINASDTVERKLQELVEKAPWLLTPEWHPITMNAPLERFRQAFEAWYEGQYHKSVTTSAIENPRKQPDFVLVSYGGTLEIVEIKKPKWALKDHEFDRAMKYLVAIKRFFKEHRAFQDSFATVRLTFVCDEVGLENEAYTMHLEQDGQIRRKTWQEILNGTLQAHEDFLMEVRRMQGLLDNPVDGSGDGGRDDSNPAPEGDGK